MSKMKVNRIENTATTAGGLDIDSSGKVGIGTTSPDAELDVNGRIYLAEGNELAWHNGAGAQAARIYGSATDELRFDIGSTASRALTIDSSGRLLVGTSSASLANKFLLQGDTSSANNGGYMRLQTNNSVVAGTSLGSIGFGDSANNGALIEARGDVSWSPFTKGSRLEFSTTADGASSPTERMRIKDNGDILIHKTTPGIGVDGLELSNTNGTNVAVTQSGNGVAAFSVNMRYGAGDQYPFYFYYNGGFVGYIKVDSTSAFYSTSSDYRLKENVVPISDAFERLLQLKPSRFNFIVEPDRVVDGFLAHEVQDIVPESIGGEKDGVDADGNPVYQGIDQSKLVPLLTAALQEAITKIETLETKVAALEAS